MRTHRVRPSEKKTLRVIFGFAPQGLSPRLAPRGGAGSARPKGWHGLDRDISALGPWPFAYAPGGNEMPGHPEGRTTRTHRVRPSEKNALRVIPGFPPQGPLALDGLPPGGAGSARPQGGLALDPDMWPVGPRAIFNACGGKEMPWHSFGRTKRTRGVRPSEKIAYPRTSPRQAISPGRLHPAEGRALHARIGKHRLDRGMRPVGQPAFCLIVG
jgi:hypothetical protein